jgi:hypothetical protein
MNQTETITWFSLAKQKPNPAKGIGRYLVTSQNGYVDYDTWYDGSFFKSEARDPKTGNRDYDEFAIAWAEMPKGYIEPTS